MLLYLTCFLTSFPAPGRGPASPSWGGPTVLLPTLPCWGSPSSRLLLPPVTLTSFGSSQRSSLQSLPRYPSLRRF